MTLSFAEQMILVCRRLSITLPQKNSPMPWLKILSSPATWANLLAILCHEIPVYLIFMFVPRFLFDAMRVGIQTISLLSVMPIVCFFVAKVRVI